MKLKPGDTVRFKDEKGEGKVIAILNKDEALILLPEGIEIPVPIKSLVKVEIDLSDSIKSISLPMSHDHERPKGKKAEKEPKKPVTFEIDLHIGQLVNNFSRSMSNGEMLTIQINHFQYWMDKAMRENFKSLVFIHGVGNGVLKSEIRRLVNTYHGVRYEDASFRRYGYGATEVFFF